MKKRDLQTPPIYEVFSHFTSLFNFILSLFRFLVSKMFINVKNYTDPRAHLINYSNKYLRLQLNLILILNKSHTSCKYSLCSALF